MSWMQWGGLIGVALILAAYLMLQVEWLKSKGLAFPLMNAVGAALVLVSLLEQFNLSAFIIEIFWLGISVYGLVRLRKTKRRIR